ncbi:hypothetical protein EZS27_017795 [termite gut metagenome]|uniref:BACON domain-containing protein n=1 Tax=termite gut metagenome TaxID=433724 RepID=A0A5J4RKF8_9ZZZZ
MKKCITFWKYFLVALPLFVWTACSEEKEEPVAEPVFELINSADGAIAFGIETGSKTIAIAAANVEGWTVTSDADWCTVQRGGEGNNVVVISVSKNEGTTERSATVSAKAGNLSIAIKVTQVGSALVLHLLNENDRTINFPTEGGNRSVGIVTNLSKEDWEYTVSNNVGNWLSVTKSAAGTSLEITAPANTGNERSVTITLSSSKLTAGTSSESRTITVTQAAWIPVLQLLNAGDQAITIPSGGGDRSVSIHTNLSKEDWEYTVNNNVGNWLGVTKSVTDNALEISASANSEEERSATITLSSSKLTQGTGNELRTITVTQYVNPIVIVTGFESNSIVLNGESSQITFDVTTNIDLTLTAPSWITLSQDNIGKGANALTITATVAENDISIQARTGNITIKLANANAGDNTWTLTVEQAALYVWQRLALTGGTWVSKAEDAVGSDFYTSNPNNDYNFLTDDLYVNNWQTEWNGTLKQPTLSWLQVDLKESLSIFRFEFFGKKNKDICPVTFKIYGWKGSGEPYKPAKYVSPDLLDLTDERIAWVNEIDNWFVIGEETHTNDFIAFSTLACTTGFAKVYNAESPVRYIRFATTESTGSGTAAATTLETVRPAMGLLELIISKISLSSGE